MRDSSFWEDWLKEMVSDAAMNPSDKVWHDVRGKVYSGHRRLFQLIVLPVFVFLFCGIWLNTGTFRSVTLPEQNTSLQKEISSPADRYSRKELSQPAVQAAKISHNKVNDMYEETDNTKQATIQLISHTQRFHSAENNFSDARPSISIINTKKITFMLNSSGNLSDAVSATNTPVKTPQKKNALSARTP